MADGTQARDTGAALNSPDLGVTLYTMGATAGTPLTSPLPTATTRQQLQPLYHFPPASLAAPPPPLHQHTTLSSAAASLGLPMEPVGYPAPLSPACSEGGVSRGDMVSSATGTSYIFPAHLATQSYTPEPCSAVVGTTSHCGHNGVLDLPSPHLPASIYPSYDFQSSGTTYSSAMGPSSCSLGWVGLSHNGAYGGQNYCSSYTSPSNSGLSFSTTVGLPVFQTNLFPHHHHHHRSSYAPYHGSHLAGCTLPNTTSTAQLHYYNTLHGIGTMDHRGNPRPQYSFSALIAMAIKSSPKQMLTLPEIYAYISQKFPYYRKEDKPWKNAVRHNLSLNKCFMKAPREDGYHGKGNHWIIDPNCDHILENGSFRSPTKKKKSKKTRVAKKTPPLAREDGPKRTVCKERPETEAILDPQTSLAEVVIPPIENEGADNSRDVYDTTSSHCNGHVDLGPSSALGRMDSAVEDSHCHLSLHALTMSDCRVVPSVSPFSQAMMYPSGEKALNFPVERLLS